MSEEQWGATSEAAWAETKVADLIRDCVSWLVLLQMAELGLLPEV